MLRPRNSVLHSETVLMTWIHIGQIRGKHWDRIAYRVDDALGIGSLGQDLAANRISVT